MSDPRTRLRPARRSAFAFLTMLGLLGCAAAPVGAGAHASWTTYHRDAARTGVDPDGVDPLAPVLSWQSADLGAPMWGQPLVLGSRVYVATVGDEVYSLDAATGKVVWKANAGTPVPAGKIECGDVDPTIGIVGTPVIDPVSETLFAVPDTWDATHEEAHHLLVGFRLSDGERVLSTPVDPPGADPKKLLERPALNLAAGRVVFGFGGNAGDCGSYDGVVGSAPETGGPPSFWRYEPAPPSIGGAAVWAPSGAAVDGEGNVYVGTGNPNPKGAPFETFDYSDSLLELSSGMSLLGWFEPPSWKKNSTGDEDLGSAGPTLLPGGLLFQAGKSTIGYLIEEAGMAGGAPAVYSEAVCKVLKEEGEGSFGGDAYADGTIYVPCVDGVRALSYEQAKRRFAPLWHGPADANGPPIVSSGSVWVLATGPFLEGGGQKLYGLDPATGTVRYTLALPSPVVDHFASPSAGGGRLFVATGSTVTAYQIAHLPPEATTGGVGEVSASSAVVSGSANVHSVEGGDCEFEYGPTPSYGSSVLCSPSPAGEGETAVGATLGGLAAASSYHYRLHVGTAAGQAWGADGALTTAATPPETVISAGPVLGSPPTGGHVGVLAATPTPARLLSSTVAAAGGRIALRIACTSASGSCAGSISIAAFISHGHRRLRVVLAASAFSIPRGRVGVLRLRLSAAARRLLAHRTSLHATVTLVDHDAGSEELPVSAPLAIRRRR